MPDGEMPVSAVKKAASDEATEVGGKPAVKLTAYADGAATVIVAVGDNTVDGIMVATMAGYDENREKCDEVRPRSGPRKQRSPAHTGGNPARGIGKHPERMRHA